MNPDDFEKLRFAVEQLTLVVQRLNTQYQTTNQVVSDGFRATNDIVVSIMHRLERLEKFTGTNH